MAKETKQFVIVAKFYQYFNTADPRAGTLRFQPTVGKEIKAVSEKQAWFFCFREYPKKRYYCHRLLTVEHWEKECDFNRDMRQKGHYEWFTLAEQSDDPEVQAERDACPF